MACTRFVFTKSQNGLKAPLEIFSPTSCLKHGQVHHVAQGHVQLDYPQLLQVACASV